MKNKLNPTQQEVVDKIKSGAINGKQYEYETRNPHGNERNFHKVKVEDGRISDTIVTTGKFFNGKENERYTTPPNERGPKTDYAIWKFVEKAPYRFKEVLQTESVQNKPIKNHQNKIEKATRGKTPSKKINIIKLVLYIVFFIWFFKFIFWLLKKVFIFLKNRRSSNSAKKSTLRANRKIKNKKRFKR